MGWSIGFDGTWKRDIGYGVVAYCDHPGCITTIDRGLSFVCGEEPYGGDCGCGLYFCGPHRGNVDRHGHARCARCAKAREPFTPKPDHPAWIAFKLRHKSWAVWRAAHPTWVAEVTPMVEAIESALAECEVAAT